MPFAPFAKAVAAWPAPSTLPAILSLPPASTTHAARSSPPNVDLQLETSRPRPSAFAREVEQLIARMAEETGKRGAAGCASYSGDDTSELLPHGSGVTRYVKMPSVPP